MLNNAVLGLFRSRDLSDHSVDPDAAAVAPPASGQQTTSPSSDLAEQLMQDGRYALLLRPQIARTLLPEQLQLAVDTLRNTMSEVPAGEVELALWTASLSRDRTDSQSIRLPVEPLFIDRFAVTNDQFHRFVAAGGYEQPSFWNPTVWPRVTEFTDSTGSLGPRQWSNGTFPKERTQHPVVGISWFEADAFARWVGKRLPCDAEWVKAASWPVSVGGAPPTGRRYPWGDVMDSARTNLWFSGQTSTAPVSEYSAGASAGQVYQLVGNVWEWTSTEFQVWIDDMRADLDEPLMSVRGAAFDSYFERHAGCQALSGESPLSRRHNIGLRCALSACDVLLGHTD